jgi:hypothetical protein
MGSGRAIGAAGGSVTRVRTARLRNGDQTVGGNCIPCVRRHALHDAQRRSNKASVRSRSLFSESPYEVSCRCHQLSSIIINHRISKLTSRGIKKSGMRLTKLLPGVGQALHTMCIISRTAMKYSLRSDNGLQCCAAACNASSRRTALVTEALGDGCGEKCMQPS